MAEMREIKLTLLPTHPCPYLPGREARSEGFLVQRMSPEVYLGLMDVGFRRSGGLVYRPKCVGCTACRPLRVGVETFVATSSQRRVWRRNLDLSVRVAKPRATEEKFEMYATCMCASGMLRKSEGECSFVRGISV